MSNTILVTGGAGFIGSHTCVLLLQNGYEVVVIDNFCNADTDSIARVEYISGKKVDLFRADLRDEARLKTLFASRDFYAVLHFASLKSAPESLLQPLDYYDNNINSTLSLLKVMDEYGVNRLIFSSTAAVYGNALSSPLQESLEKCEPTSPYAISKLNIESILCSLPQTNANWKIISLRYFNPIGAHPSGELGEQCGENSGNVMFAISAVILKKVPAVTIFGSDYPTKDGTAIRDYIHVMDVAQGHIAALRNIDAIAEAVLVNLGTGRGVSVLELIDTYARVNRVKLERVIAPRRQGDIAVSFASPKLAGRLLQWQSRYTLEQMCQDSHRWIIKQ